MTSLTVFAGGTVGWQFVTAYHLLLCRGICHLLWWLFQSFMFHVCLCYAIVSFLAEWYYLLGRDDLLALLCIVFLTLFHMVSLVRCGTWWYRFLIFSFFSTFIETELFHVKYFPFSWLFIHWNELYWLSCKARRLIRVFIASSTECSFIISRPLKWCQYFSEDFLLRTSCTIDHFNLSIKNVTFKTAYSIW